MPTQVLLLLMMSSWVTQAEGAGRQPGMDASAPAGSQMETARPNGDATSAQPAPRSPAQGPDDAVVEPRPPKTETEEVALPPSALPPKLDHRHQFGFELGLGLGYRIIKPYGDIWCGDRTNDPDNPNEPFCSSMSPLFLDMGLSFGASATVEVVVHARTGLIKDPISDRRPISLFAGVRLWVDSEGAFKWALGLEGMVDFTKQDGTKQQRPGYGIPDQDELDVGGRFYGQIQYDFLQYVGLYAQFSGLVGALRWLRVELEGTVGVQARLPRL